MSFQRRVSLRAVAAHRFARVKATLWTLGVLAALLGFGASFASAAAFVQVGTFAESGEEVQLGGASGMAVNVNGAGGVAPGTVYAAVKGQGTRSRDRQLRVCVARFNPDETFSEAWEVTEVEEPYERCGPDLGDMS
jgi:hypothetical protein